MTGEPQNDPEGTCRIDRSASRQDGDRVVRVERDWPVVRPVALKAADDETYPRVLDLGFAAVTDGGRCSILAVKELMAVGSLRWWIRQADPEQLEEQREAIAAGEDPGDPEPGEIMDVYVLREYRREGIARAMWTMAEAYAEHYGLPMPKHSTRRTQLGDAWAQAMGASPAREIIPPAEGER